MKFDVNIRGDGPVALSLALGLAKQGFTSALSLPASTSTAASDCPPTDVRAYAINAQSKQWLESLRVWGDLPSTAITPMVDMLVQAPDDVQSSTSTMPTGNIQGTSSAHRNAQLHFSARSVQRESLGWIVESSALMHTLRQAVRYAPSITTLNAENTANRNPLHANRPLTPLDSLTSTSMSPVNSGALHSSESAFVDAALLAICEGKDSHARTQAHQTAGHHAFGRQAHPYGHSAIAARLVSSHAHAGRAWQWFKNGDILALLPCQDHGNQHDQINQRDHLNHASSSGHYALVWSMPHARALELQQQDEVGFIAALNAVVQQQAGSLQLSSARAVWPLHMALDSKLYGHGWILLGDAAHSVHPLAGQGLNLGLADAQSLCDTLARARVQQPWQSLGHPSVLAKHARARHLPVQRMVRTCDALWHTFASTHALAKPIRNIGLGLVNTLGPLKHWLVAQALKG